MSTKYAIVNAFGRQFKVREGDKIRANFVEGDVGTTITLPEVYMINTGSEIKVGAPTISGAKVVATLDSQIRDDKVLVFKYRQSNRYKKTRGHRQPYTVLQISSIEG